MPPSALLAAAIVACAALLPGQQEPAAVPAPGMQRFESLTRTFHIDVPAGWRQLSPGDASELRAAHPDLPAEVLSTSPGLFYAVGDVDRWHRGDFDGVLLYVVEQGNEWHTPDQDLTKALESMWQKAGSKQGCRYEVSEVRSVRVGTEAYEAIQCVRRRHGTDPAATAAYLDTYLPTGGRELSLSLRCREQDLPQWEPRFRAMLATLTLARKAHGQVTLTDRLWTPIVTGALVGLGIIVLYRWTRRRN